MLADRISMRTRTWRCVIVLLVAVAGIVTGLLAMHVVSTTAGQPHEYAAAPTVSPASADSSHAVEAHAIQAHAGMSGVSLDSGCAGGCDPTHDMTVMVCTLALLAATVLLLAPAWSRAMPGTGPRAAAANLIGIVARSVGSRPPPSLLALSVDRR